MSKLATWLARSKTALTQPEVLERLEKIERAVELQYLDQPQARVDHDLASGVAELVISLNETKAAAIQIGSLLILKVTTSGDDSKILVRHLTRQELLVLQRDPDLLTKPAEVLAALRDRSGAAVDLSNITT